MNGKKKQKNLSQKKDDKLIFQKISRGMMVANYS